MKELDELQKGLQSKLSKLDGNTRDATDTSTSHVVTLAEGTEDLRSARSGAPVPGTTSDANERGKPETLECNSHPHGTEPERFVGTFSTTRSRWVERNGSIDPVVGQNFAQSDLKNRHSVDERGGEEPRSDVSGSGERTLGDCAFVPGDARLESKEDVTAPREGSPAVEDHSSKDDSDSLEEISYINDNTTGRYAHEKDSWISSDEDETREATPPRDENRVLPPATDVTEAIHYITSLDPARHGLPSGLNAEEDREIFEADQGGSDETNTAVASDVDKLIPADFEEKPAPREMAERAVSDGELSDTNHSNERDVKPQSSVPAIPNFFMPTEQLEQSMRALRLAASFHPAATGLEDATKSKSKLLSRSAARSNAASGGLAEEFAKRRLVYKERADPPITSDEAQRIARIFSSKNLV